MVYNHEISHEVSMDISHILGTSPLLWSCNYLFTWTQSCVQTAEVSEAC